MLGIPMWLLFLDSNHVVMLLYTFVRSIELENRIMYALYIIVKTKCTLDTGSSIHFLGAHLPGDVCDVAVQDPNRHTRS